MLTSKKLAGTDITIEDMMEEDQGLGESDIAKTFNGANIFITGGTGFVGKLLIEKLLRCCPQIQKIYVLVREKKGKQIQERIQDLCSDLIYDKLKKQQPKFQEKLVALKGDVNEMGIGLSSRDREIITSEVNIIFHGAATVRFDEPLKQAVFTNTRGTRELMVLARTCRKLKALVHISTAYSNCHLDSIEEKFYDVSLDPEKLIDLAETLDEDIMKDVSPGFIGKYPNSYTYTKSAAEHIVMKYCQGLPVSVVRPSIILATYKEPLEGWLDNIYGPSALVVGAGVGVIRVVPGDVNKVVDFVPADLVVSTCIAAAWRTATTELPVYPPPIYHACTSTTSPVTWGSFNSRSAYYGKETPSAQTIYAVMSIMLGSRFWIRWLSFFLHWVPAYIVDGLAILTGKKPQLKKVYTKVDKMTDTLFYFASREWKIYSHRTAELFKSLNMADKELFNFNYAEVDWDEYIRSYVRGLRAYIIKESPDTIPQALKLHKKLELIHKIVCIVATVLIIFLFYGVFYFILSLFM